MTRNYSHMRLVTSVFLVLTVVVASLAFSGALAKTTAVIGISSGISGSGYSVPISGSGTTCVSGSGGAYSPAGYSSLLSFKGLTFFGPVVGKVCEIDDPVIEPPEDEDDGDEETFLRCEYLDDGTDGVHSWSVTVNESGNETAVEGSDEYYYPECTGTGIFSVTETFAGGELQHESTTLVETPVCRKNPDGDGNDEVDFVEDPCGGDDYLCEYEIWAPTNGAPSDPLFNGCMLHLCTEDRGNLYSAARVDSHLLIEWTGNQCATDPAIGTYVERGICVEHETDGVVYHTAELPQTPLPNVLLCPTACFATAARSTPPQISCT